MKFKSSKYYLDTETRTRTLKFVFSDSRTQYFLIPPLSHDNRCQCRVSLSFRAPVANISLTLYLFNPDSAKVLIQFPNTVVASARDTFSSISERSFEKLSFQTGMYRVFQYGKAFLKVLFS